MPDAILKLLAIRCDRRQEWFGADEIEILIQAGGDTRQFGPWEFGDADVGVSKALNAEFPFSGVATLDLKEIDSVSNDLVGTLLIRDDETEIVSRTIVEPDGAQYTVRYQVIVPVHVEEMSPEPWTAPIESRERNFCAAPVGTPVATCGRQQSTWIELRYLYADGRGVPEATYWIARTGHREAPMATGPLNRNGFVRVEGVPYDCSDVEYWFDNDPQSYQLFEEFKPIDVGSIPASDLDWVLKAIAGDFNEDQDFGQIAFNTILGVVPVVDQVFDVRDLAANLYHLLRNRPDGEEPGYKRWELWVAIILTAIGCIPGVGSIVKGIGKALLRHAADGAKAVYRLLVRILNFFGKGNAKKWLVNLLEELPKLLKTAGDFITDILEGILAKAYHVSVRFFSWLEVNLKAALAAVAGNVKRLLEQLRESLKRAVKEGSERDIRSGTVQAEQRLRQEAEAAVDRSNLLPEGRPNGPDAAVDPVPPVRQPPELPGRPRRAQTPTDRHKEHLTDRDLDAAKRELNREVATSSGGPVFEASPKHGRTDRGAASRGPKDGQSALDISVQVKDSSPRRVGIDRKNGEIVVLDQTSQGKFHGHVRSWDQLNDQQRNALVKGKLTDRRGRLLPEPE